MGDEEEGYVEGIEESEQRMKNVSEITDKREAILDTLEGQAAKMTEEREVEAEQLEQEAKDIGYRDLPLSIAVLNFLKHDAGLLLLEEQRLEQFRIYIDEIKEWLIQFERNEDRVIELEEENERLGENIKGLMDQIKKLKEENPVAPRPVSVPSPAPIQPAPASQPPPTQPAHTEYPSIPPSPVGRVCERCGKDISHIRKRTKYCLDCGMIRERERKRDWARDKAAKKQGNGIDAEKNDEEEENRREVIDEKETENYSEIVKKEGEEKADETEEDTNSDSFLEESRNE